MDMRGERVIPASRETVWRALNDPSVLKVAIPGCQDLEKLGDDAFRATAAVKVGPITARFTGKVSLLDLDPPNGYRIEGEGQGGAAGFAKGGATVRLEEANGGTRLVYDVSAQVGGKLAQLGGRMVDVTAKQMSDAFFNRFATEISAPQSKPSGAAPEGASVAEPNPPAAFNVGALIPIPLLAGIGAGLLAILVWLFTRRRRPARRVIDR